MHSVITVVTTSKSYEENRHWISLKKFFTAVSVDITHARKKRLCKTSSNITNILVSPNYQTLTKPKLKFFEKFLLSRKKKLA